MNIHDLVLIIQYITISVLFIEIVIVFLNWKNSIHSYLFLALIASFVSNVGYLIELEAKSEEVYVSALKLSYLGRVWIVFAFFLFSANLCRIKIHRGVTSFLVLAHVAIYTSVLTIGRNSLFYGEYHYIYASVIPRLEHTNGIMYDLMLAFNGIMATTAMIWMIREYRRKSKGSSGQKYFMVMMAYGVQVLSLILDVTKVFSFSKYYNLTMPGTLFGTIFLLIGIIRFDLLGTSEIARDFVIDRISEGIIAVDNDGRIQYYNEPAAKLYPQFDIFFGAKKRPGERLSGKLPAISDLNGMHTPYDVISSIETALQSGDTIELGDRIFTPEKNELMYGGENYGRLYALTDDTEHYHYMEELQKQRDIADEANEAKSRFLANMSHEIRTPINAMLGMDEMILRESGDKTIRSYAKDIMSAGRTLLSLINDILDLSKVEEGKMEIICVQYDLSSLINDLVNMTRDRAEKKGLELKVRADEHIPRFLVGDEIRVKQCAMNVLTNAVKYTEKGEVTLEISFTKSDEDHIRLGILVRDTGIGMKEEDMEKLFSPYKRIEEKRNRSIEGTGLGMSITRQLLELMGSKLEVESEYGSGSVFSFEVEQEVLKWDEIGDYSAGFNDRSRESYEYHELFHAPDAAILVVDDTEMNLTVVQNLLKRTAIRIDTAASGKAALELAARNHYDVMFIDHMMPDMDGIETLKRLRESERNSEVPAVALTANAVSGAREMYLEAGFSDYLSKPVDGEKLERMLAGMLPADKLVKGDVTPEAAGDNSTEELPGWLLEMDEIDVSAGIANSGSEEGYLSVLSVFHQTARAKADEIEKFFREGDIEGYTIKVHALKSSARIIGAKELSKLAETLEDAGKREDREYIRSNSDRLLEMYRELDRKLAQQDRPSETLPQISEAELKDAYRTIVEIASSMDYGLMEELLRELRGYSLPEEDAERIGRIEDMLNSLDWDGMIKEAGSAGQ